MFEMEFRRYENVNCTRLLPKRKKKMMKNNVVHELHTKRIRERPFKKESHIKRMASEIIIIEFIFHSGNGCCCSRRIAYR